MTPSRAALVAAALALACAARAGGTATEQGGVPAREPDGGGELPYLYVTNQGGASVSILDAAEGRVVDGVDLRALGFGPNARPHDAAVDPDGSHWYVTLIGENRVLKFDRENRLVDQVEMEVPGLVVAHPTRDLLLVGRSMTAVDPPPSVALIRRSDMTLLDEIDVVFPRPHALAVGRDGRWAYTASLAENRMAAIDLETGGVELFEVPLGAVAEHPEGHAAPPGEPEAVHAPHTLVEFAISPDGRTMVAGGQLSGELLVFDLSNPSAPRLVRSSRLGGAPWHPTFTPDGRWVYFPLHDADQVAVLDAATWEVAERIEGRGLAEPHGAAPSPDGRWIFVSNNNTGGGYTPEGDETEAGTVVVIDAATRDIVKVLEVGPYAAGLETVPPR